LKWSNPSPKRVEFSQSLFSLKRHTLSLSASHRRPSFIPPKLFSTSRPLFLLFLEPKILDESPVLHVRLSMPCLDHPRSMSDGFLSPFPIPCGECLVPGDIYIPHPFQSRRFATRGYFRHSESEPPQQRPLPYSVTHSSTEVRGAPHRELWTLMRTSCGAQTDPCNDKFLPRGFIGDVLVFSSLVLFSNACASFLGDEDR